MSRQASLKISTELLDEARREAPIFSRSLAGQIEHWARLGQAVENAQGFTLDRVRAALEGRFSASDLNPSEMEIFLDLAGSHGVARRWREEFAKELLEQAGNVGYDDAGKLIRTLGGGKTEILKAADANA
jgi:hypothetical protein